MITSSPIQELEPGATPCRNGRCAARYPHGPQQPANKNTLDYDVVPADGVEPPQGHAGRGMGVGVISQAVYNDLLLVNINA